MKLNKKEKKLLAGLLLKEYNRKRPLYDIAQLNNGVRKEREKIWDLFLKIHKDDKADKPEVHKNNSHIICENCKHFQLVTDYWGQCNFNFTLMKRVNVNDWCGQFTQKSLKS